MFVKTLNVISKENVDIAGGKGASLGEIIRTGLFVPPGFVVLASAFDRFLKETDLGVKIEAIMHKVNQEDINSAENGSEEIRDLVCNAEFPKDIGDEILSEFAKLETEFVAVRSSATAEDSSVASWAGELESYLNVIKENLLAFIKQCWSSLYTPRAIFYRFEKKLRNQRVSVAVVVQKMVQSAVSGICFSVHPVTKDKDQLVIEAGYGLGEAIVGGKITPDTYVMSKSRKEILDKNISEQRIMIVKGAAGTKEVQVPRTKQGYQKLTDEQILELAALCNKIEEHYNCPQDIEWAFEKGKFFIVQSRPITTL